MAHDLLMPGTLLDGRYRIESVLGQGGFGITYAAENVRIGLKVAVKELFWRGHSVRDAAASPEAALSDGRDAPVFEEQKRRFLHEARTIRDFSGQPGVVRILDYFEANATAYIVMEYVEGETLGAKAAAPMNAEDLLRRFLPLIDSLSRIHEAGIIHRDISPDNIMVQPDGSMKLIDFGAARAFNAGGGRYTAIAKDSYSPGEQYDKNGQQGPWTDVYSLCATLYTCVTGSAPPGSVQRMFLDELQPPSALGIAIDPAYEAILMKGLQLQANRRYQTMGQLAEAIRAALPKPVTVRQRGRGWLWGLLAGLAVAAIVAGAFAWRQYDTTHKFRNVATERLRFPAPADMSAADFADMQKVLREWLEDFAGKNNYLFSVDGAQVDVVLPLSCFDGKPIPETVRETLDRSDSRTAEMQFYYESQAVWEDPARSLISGTNQVMPDALKGPTVQCAYRPFDDITRGQRANLIVDLKTRLDALDMPYAFGTVYGDDSRLMIRLSPDHLCDWMVRALGDYALYVSGSPESSEFYVGHASYPITVVPLEDGAWGLEIRENNSYDIQKMEDYTRAMLEAGMRTMYLLSADKDVIATAPLEAPITDGTLLFRDFAFENAGTIDAENRWIVDFLATMVNDTALPTSCPLESWECRDEKGEAQLDDVKPEYGLRTTAQPMDEAVLEDLRRVNREMGYEITYNDNSVWILFDLPLDDRLPAEAPGRVEALLNACNLRRAAVDRAVFLMLTDEGDDLRCRLMIRSGYDYKEKRFKTFCDAAFIGDGLGDAKAALEEWWKGWDRAAFGMEETTF